jgi:UDP-N-acetylmuramate dehydrogenase
MADPLVERLRAAVAGDVRGPTPLASFTTLRVGGPAAALVRAERVDDLEAVAAICADEGRPWLVLGRGSNLLVADEGWPGVAIVLGRGFRGVETESAGIIAGAAEPMPALARAASAAGLGGLAFGVAIPGTLGGAVRMNAGAHGREVGDVLAWAEAVRMDGGARVQRFAVDDLAMTYRHSDLPADSIVVRARLDLDPAEAPALAAEMDELRRWRRQHQPTEPSCGSVFRNPTGDSAGRLVEEAGLKGRRSGRAEISAVHANFIVTRPGATAAQVRRLISEARDEVAARFGITLQTEVVLAGFDEDAR